MMDNVNSINLNKYISSTGICSRREAEKFIIEGRVTINGNVSQLGNRVSKGDKVKVDGRLLETKSETIYIALNKPIGIVSTTDSKERDNIVKFVGHPERLFPIGRLDKPSEGLIFLTNDGDIVNKILRAGNDHEKEYIVTVNKSIDDTFISEMAGGIPILGTMTKKCRLTKINENTFTIILIQGLNRQIRRMCEYLGYEVTKLKRTRIMNVSLGTLAIGDWRELTSQEMIDINNSVSKSTKTDEPSPKKKSTPKKKNNSNTKTRFKTSNNSRIGKSKVDKVKSKNRRK